MKVKQYVRFLLFSSTVDIEELSSRVGMPADYSEARGSRLAGKRPLPPRHRWEIRCDSPGLRIDEQLEMVISRLRPFEAGIAALARELSAQDPRDGAVFCMVRHFDEPEGEEEVPRHAVVRGHELESVPGQHQLLGWHIDKETLEFILRLDAEIDGDEYG
jgi:hypothetical protein